MFKREHTTTTYDVRRVVYPRGRAHIVNAPVEILIRRVMKERTAGGGVAVPLQLPVDFAGCWQNMCVFSEMEIALPFRSFSLPSYASRV